MIRVGLDQERGPRETQMIPRTRFRTPLLSDRLHRRRADPRWNGQPRRIHQPCPRSAHLLRRIDRHQHQTQIDRYRQNAIRRSDRHLQNDQLGSWHVTFR
jgi:hypothetical protein